MCMNVRSRLVLAKPEATQGTDAAPVVGTDDLFVTQGSTGIKLGISVLENMPASPTGYELPGTTGTRKPSATYQIPLYGKGRTGDLVNLPSYLSVLLASCGFIDRSTGSPAGSIAIWYPDIASPRFKAVGGTVTDTLPTFTIYDYMAREGTVAAGTKVLMAMVGCRVQTISLNLTVGQYAFLEITVLGQYVKPAAVTTDLSAFDLDNVRTDFLRANGATQKFSNGSDLVLQASSTVWSIDFGTQQIEGDTTDSGVSCVVGGAPKITGTANPVIVAAEIDTYADIQDAQTVVTYGMNGSMTPEGRTVDTGWTVRVASPGVQFMGDYETGTGTLRQALALKAVSPDATTPPLSITWS